MKWSQLKKRIKDRFADSVRKRIDFGVTAYGPGGPSKVRGWIRLDKKEILNLEHCGECFYPDEWPPERREQYPNLFPVDEFIASLNCYLNLSIDEILECEDRIIRAFGMLDARVGKRRLKRMDAPKEHDLVRRLFYLRCDAEGLLGDDERIDLTSRLTVPPLYPIDRDLIAEHRSAAVKKLAANNRMRDFTTLITRVHNGELTEDQLQTDVSRAVHQGFKNSTDPDALLRTLRFLDSKTKLCDDVTRVRAIIAMAEDHVNWLRPLREWAPRTHNRKRQFASLARHLWAQYDVPAFMDNAWLQGTVNHQQWYKDIGKGKSIRNSENLPFPLTKKMAHHFLAAPDHYSVDGALRWGQIHALGGDQRLADALLETRLVKDFRDNDFCLSLIRFFIRNPMLDTVHIGPIIDYIWNQRYENQVVFVERGVAEEIGSPQPNFSMRGRTVTALLRAVEQWHGQLSEESKWENLQWPKCGIREFSFVEGDKQNEKRWTIKELLSGHELIEEGKQMDHCVASYAGSCHSGKRSIWSMECETREGKEKLLTIEVDNAAREIRQVRGWRNRLSTEAERTIIRRWGCREDLQHPSYLS